MLNGEISKRECEIYTLQSRLEMVDKQQQDQNHHINVLKEQVKTREHKISMLTADVSDMRHYGVLIFLCLFIIKFRNISYMGNL